MKKQLFLFVMILLPMVASAHDIEVKNADGVTIYYNYINNGTELEVTRRGSSHNSYTGNVVIPNEVTYMNRTRKVTSIGNCAFSSCSALTSVTIPNNVTNIGRDAFRDGSSEECPSLASIVVESGNPIYDSRDNCNAIVETKNNILRFGCKNTIIPNSVTYIGSYAFRGCSKLTSINIPNSVTGINICAFQGCTALTSIVIPNSVTSLSESVFSGCSSLTSVTIPNSVSYIASDTFRYCSRLTSINIPNSVKGIGWWAFAGCISLTSVNIPNSVTNIGDYAFSGCSGLTSVTIPNSVTSIGCEAFSNCHGLTSIYIPNSITSIGKDAFSGCDCLTGVYINNVGEWCKIIFDNSYSNPLRCAHKLFINGEEIRDLVIPNGVTSIGDYSFCGCSCITSVTIPNNVTAIREGAFYGCSGLTSVTIGSGVKLLYKHAFDTQSELKDVYCYAINVPGTESDAIYNSKYATLHVPEQSIDAYKAADPWKRFKNIVALKDSDPKPDVTGVNVIRSSGVKMAVSYNLNGVRLSEPQKGINIINGKKYVKK